MSIENFKEQLNSVFKCIDFCINNNLLMPALVQMYSLIDSMSWIYMPRNKTDNTREDFINWVNTFLLKNSLLECNAWDLYAARCAIVHTMSPRAKLIREGKARTICYCCGDKSIEELKQIFNNGEMKGRAQKDRYVAVHINDLYRYIKIAIDKFSEYVFQEKRNLELFSKRINEYFIQFNFN